MESIGLSAAIGRNVATLRTRRGISQVDLAGLVKRRFGLAWSTNTVARIELGHREVLAGELVALGMALSVGPEELLQVEEPVRLGRGASASLSSDEVVAWVAGTASPSGLWDGLRDRIIKAIEKNQQQERDKPEGFGEDSLLESMLAERLLGEEWLNASVGSYFSVWEDIQHQLDEWTKGEEAAGRPVTTRRLQGKRAYLWRHASEQQDGQDTFPEQARRRRSAKRSGPPQASST